VFKEDIESRMLANCMRLIPGTYKHIKMHDFKNFHNNLVCTGENSLSSCLYSKTETLLPTGMTFLLWWRLFDAYCRTSFNHLPPPVSWIQAQNGEEEVS